MHAFREPHDANVQIEAVFGSDYPNSDLIN